MPGVSYSQSRAGFCGGRRWGLTVLKLTAALLKALGAATFPIQLFWVFLNVNPLGSCLGLLGNERRSSGSAPFTAPAQLYRSMWALTRSHYFTTNPKEALPF